MAANLARAAQDQDRVCHVILLCVNGGRIGHAEMKVN